MGVQSVDGDAGDKSRSQKAIICIYPASELALFLKATDLDGMGILKGTGLVRLAASINILADAVGAFGTCLLYTSLLIKNKDTQSIKVTVNNEDNSSTKTYKLTGLTPGGQGSSGMG